MGFKQSARRYFSRDVLLALLLKKWAHTQLLRSWRERDKRRIKFAIYVNVDQHCILCGRFNWFKTNRLFLYPLLHILGTGYDNQQILSKYLYAFIQENARLEMLVYKEFEHPCL